MRHLLLLVLLTACAHPALAQTKPASKEPIEVTAKKTLEWHREAKMYIAREDAIAKQGTSEIHADTLTAKYEDTPDTVNKKGGTNITRIDAVGNVMIISDGSKATGGLGYYDVKTGYSELTGGNLMLQTATDTVTAQNKITYDANKNEMNAYGNAKAVRGEDTIVGDRLIGRFRKDPATGESKMNEMEAIGSVVITTPTEIMTGDRARYLADANTATVTGNVRIDRGPNVITGARGEVDLSTNISRMYGSGDGGPTTDVGAPLDAGGDGRVRGVFYPE